MKKRIQIWDETFRDGEQMPGVVFSNDEKKEMIKKSSEFGCDIISLMPSISKSEAELTRELCDSELRPKITALCMLNKKSIDLAKSCNVQKVFLFTAVSDIHLENKLKINRKDNLEKSFGLIKYANDLGLNVDFGAEDSTRSDITYLIDFMNSVSCEIEYFMPADTLGCLTPFTTYDFVKKLKKETDCKICLHCHNDFGQATANTLAGIVAGADLFSGTFTGIGERCGNAPIEEVVTALKYQYGQELPVKYKMISEICNLIEKYSGVELQKHKPICGENAFSHESGIHVDGVLKFPKNYENFPPEEIGRKTEIIFGKHSGKSGLRYLFGDKFDEKEYSIMLQGIKQKSQLEKRAFSRDEIMNIWMN